MTEPIDVMRIKQARGRVLTSLSLFYPSPVMVRMLYRTVCGYPTYNRPLFEKDITYLEQKSYLEFVDDKLGGADDFYDKVCILTARGKEIAEGTVVDQALEI